MIRLINSACAAALATMLLAACAPPPPFQPSPELAERAETLAALETRVQARGTFPAQDHMLPDVRLISPARVGAFETGLGHRYPPGFRPGDVRRDTMAGPLSVDRWLTTRERDHQGRTPFRFTTSRVMGCDGAVIQYGHYPVQTASREGGGETTRPFAALWQVDQDGELLLEALWMSPSSGATRPGALARGCQEATTVRDAARFAGRRIGVQAFVGAGQDAAGGSARSGFEEGGWTNGLDSSTDYYRLGLQGHYRVQPRWNVTGLLAYDPGFSVTGRPGQVGYVPTLTGSNLSIAALAVHEMGSWRIGAGPELIHTRWDWRERHLHGWVEPAEEADGSSWTPGALIHVGIVRPLWANMYMDVGGRYRIAGTSTSPAFRDMDGFEVQHSGGALVLGIGWWR